MSAQIGTLLEFLGYWFSMPGLVGTDRLIKMEGRIAWVLRLFPWFGVAYVNLASARSIYNLIVEQELLEYGLGLAFLLGPAAVAAVFSILVGIRWRSALSHLMFNRTLLSTQDILNLLEEMWDTSLKAYILRWSYRCLAVAICVVVPGWLIRAAISFFTSNAGRDIELFGGVLWIFIYLLIMTTLAFLGAVAVGYGIVTGITLLLKRFLIDLADDSTSHKRAVWWSIALSVLGLLIQMRAVESTAERLGVVAEILAFGLLAPELLEQVPRDLSRTLLGIGLAVFFSGLMLQVWSPIGWVSRIGLVVKAVSLVVALPVTYRFLRLLKDFDEANDRPVLWRSFWLYAGGVFFQLVATFLP